MATKTCPNGHHYDSSIYGDNCPFCPSSHVGSTSINDFSGHTSVNGGFATANTAATMQVKVPSQEESGGATVIRHANPTGGTELNAGGGNRKLVAILATYSHNPLGEIFKVYEGRNIVGRSSDCDITISGDSNVSGKHLLILYREVEKKFWIEDQNSSNGTFVNGVFTGDKTQVNANDVITIGNTQLIFMPIPQ